MFRRIEPDMSDNEVSAVLMNTYNNYKSAEDEFNEKYSRIEDAYLHTLADTEDKIRKTLSMCLNTFQDYALVFVSMAHLIDENDPKWGAFEDLFSQYISISEGTNKIFEMWPGIVERVHSGDIDEDEI